MTTHEVTLDLDKTLQLPPPTITARQGDTQCGITAMVTDHGAPATLTGYTAKFQAAKPDGTYAEQAAHISGSTVTVELDPQFLAAAGLIRTAYFRFFEGTAEKESTQNMCIRVIHDAEGEAPDLSTSYIPTVDQLVEDATEALNSANTALGNAEEALEDAEAATDSATDAAASANAAANAAQSAIDAMTGNVLRGTVGPSEVVGVEDAYPQVPMGVKVKGVTRQNLWVNPSGTAYGITSTSNEDGTLTLSGTCTSTAYIAILVKYVYNVKPNTTYTASIDKMFKNDGNTAENYIRLFLAFGSSDNVWDKQNGFSPGSRTSFQFTTTSTTNRLVFGLQVYGNPSGVSVSGTYRVMLNEGSEAEPWCPPGINGVDELGIVTAGKNLLARMGPSLPYTFAGITFSDNGDGGIRVSGTATAAAYYNFFSDSHAKALRITPGEYTASLIGGGSGLNLSVGYYDSGIGGSYTAWLATNVPAISNTGSIDRPVYLRPFLSVAKGKTVDTVVYPQLELGSTATAYEPPAVTTTTPIDLDGHTLNSLPDGTRDELTIDATGAVTLTKRVGVATYDGSEDEVWNYVSNRIGLNNGAPGSESLLKNTNGRCNTLPIREIGSPTAIMCYDGGWVDIRIDNVITDAQSGKEWLAANHTTLLYPLATPQTIPLTAVTLPALPGPTANVWAVATDGRGNTFTLQPEIELEYARDVTLVIGSLEAKVAALELLHESE